MTKFLIFAVFISFIALGLGDGVFGVAWPGVRGEFGLALELAFVVTMSHAISYALAGAVMGRLEKRLALYRINAAGLVLIATGAGAISFAPNFAAMAAFTAIMGFGMGLTDSSMNAFAARHFSARQMNLLHCMWGVGAAIAPVIMTQMSLAFSWRAGYMGMMAIQAGVLAVVLLSIARGVWVVREVAKTDTTAPTAEGNFLQGKRFQIAHMVIFFLYTFGEYSISFWTVTVMLEARGIDFALAGMYPAVYLGSIMVGRLVFGFIADRFSGTAIVRAGLGLSVVGLILLIFTDNIAGMALIGLGFAPVFPCVMHLTSNRFHSDVVATLVGRQIAAVGAAAAVGSVAMGQVLANISLEALFPVVIACVAAVFAINEYVERAARRS